MILNTKYERSPQLHDLVIENIDIYINIDKDNLKNIDDIDSNLVILENISIDMDLLENINIYK